VKTGISKGAAVDKARLKDLDLKQYQMEAELEYATKQKTLCRRFKTDACWLCRCQDVFTKSAVHAKNQD